MRTSGGVRFANVNESHHTEDYQSNGDRNQILMKKQNEQIIQMKEHYVKLRNSYHTGMRESSLKVLELQRQVDLTRKKRQNLEQKVSQLQEAAAMAMNEKVANDVIERLWSILQNYRKEVFAECGEPLTDNDNYYSNHKNNNNSKKSYQNRHNDSVKNTPNVPFDDFSDDNNNNIIFDNSDDSSVPMTPTTPINSPMTPMTPSSEDEFGGSIASRRSRRKCTNNVYYKEPSLRKALSPGDPFTFSLEEGTITPTLPDDYSRKSPSVPTRRKYNKRK